MDVSSLREATAFTEALILCGVIGLVLVLALVICWPLRRRDEFDAMQQPFGDQPWWLP
ncbi:MAG: hypothetical protein J0H51_13115 [Rhizobiales bacterium]|nr:hypothetical protein [Hyphomicrobiales bacterium]